MSVEFDKEKSLENLKRQSKRMATLLDVPLNEAQYMLSVHVYAEASFSDVRRKVDSGNFSGNIYLAAVSPDGKSNALDTFAKNFGDIYLRLEQGPIPDLYAGSLRDFLFKLFDLTPERMSSIQ